MAEWCRICCTVHRPERRCPGELQATGTERHGWRVNVETQDGMEAFGVLVAESYGVWRARILTFPNILWLVPGGGGTLKFVGDSPQEAERQAIQFILRHCDQRGFEIRHDTASALPAGIEAEAALGVPAPPTGGPAPRKIRFLKVHFGIDGATETARTGNLSETGIFIMTEIPEPSGHWLNMLLDVDRDSLQLRGLVRWSTREHHVGRSPGMGIQLRPPPPNYLTYVRGLL